MVSPLEFAARFLRNPGRIGAVAPSSRCLGHTITAGAGLEQADVVVEYGPGTGAFTPHILRRLKEGATFFALELDAAMCNAFRRRFPGVAVYCDSVANVSAYLASHGVSRADSIVSGLPWAAFSAEYQDELIQPTLASLADGGRFVTFAYLHGLLLSRAAAFRRNLERHFARVTTSGVVWWNLPPAFVYQCVK